MASLLGLLLFPVTGPAHGLRFVLEQLREEAETALYDEGRIHSELAQLSTLRDAGELDDEEYAEQEEALLARLNEAHAVRESLSAAEEYDPLEESEQEMDR